jgi:tungstate transport system substrate-binding protein
VSIRPVVLVTAIKRVRGFMSLYRTLVVLVVTAFFGLGQAGAQERTIRVGAPAGPLVQLVQTLAPAFQAQTGITVTATELKPAAPLSVAGADAALVPSRLAERLQPTGAAPSRVIFFGDVILVGSRAEMARVRGLKDIRTALRWIASARGTYMSSSAALGTRELELSLWESIGVNVQTRSTWYLEGRGDEASVLRQAGSMGAYILIERVTWVSQENRRGLEVLVQGDPALRTNYTSSLVIGAPEEATAWHDWLSSEQAQAIVARFSLGGVRVFLPATSRDGEEPPAKT